MIEEKTYEIRGLEGVTVAVPETRQLNILSNMLQKRGAQVVPVPLVAIHDSPDREQVLAWMRSFIAAPPDYLVLLTGEGLRRLLSLADAEHLSSEFVAALGKVCTLCRGPKPERVLAELGLKAGIQAAEPTTAGVISSLGLLELAGLSVAVQLYGEEPNLPLQDFLREAGARISLVAPYVYASQEEEGRVIELIEMLAAGQIDVLAFTSQSQFRRLSQVARSRQLQDSLDSGMRKTRLAAVGPVVRDQLQEAGYKVAIMPERVYFMKPLVRAIERCLQSEKNS